MDTTGPKKDLAHAIDSVAQKLAWPGPARKNTGRVFKHLTTTDTHEFIQLFL